MRIKKHILVVEDEAHLATGIKYNLKAEGFEVTTVGDGVSALTAFDDDPQRFDLIVLDLMLPGMSGYDVCQQLRHRRVHVPVLILSARTLAEDRARGFDVGADQYMLKPFDLDEFLSRVRNLLARFGMAGVRSEPAAETEAAVYEFSNTVIDFRRYEVRVDGRSVRLTQMEMKLLRYFVEHADRVIPRRELLEQVWDMPGTVQTRAPDQFIRRLRKIFEPDPSNPVHLLTIRDAGYRFTPEADVGNDGESGDDVTTP